MGEGEGAAGRHAPVRNPEPERGPPAFAMRARPLLYVLFVVLLASAALTLTGVPVLEQAVKEGRRSPAVLMLAPALAGQPPAGAGDRGLPYRFLLVISDQWKDPASYLVDSGGEFDSVPEIYLSCGVAGAALIIATDVSDYRLGLAKQVGADQTVNVKASPPEAVSEVIRQLTAGEGVDAALEMSGDPAALHQAFRAVKNGGRVTLFGIPTGPITCDLANEIIFKGIRVHGITGRRLFSTWYRLAGLFKAGLNIKPIVTHTFPMSDFARGFDLIKSGQCGKVVLFP